jgi:hypothetical protein
MNKGCCVCDSICYETEVIPFDYLYSYCSICRGLTGGAMGAYGTVLKTDINWVRGEQLLSVYQQNKDSKRMFCSCCGSFMLSTHELAPEKLYLSLGCLETDYGLTIEYQQLVASKPAWAKLDLSVARYDAWPHWIHKRITKKP